MGLSYIARESLRELYEVPTQRINTVDNRITIPDQFFGVEIEIEGLPSSFIRSTIPGWNIIQDGSLRGSNSREYVSDGPQAPGQLLPALNAFYDRAASANLDINQVASFRTSIHVHMDFTRATPYSNGLPHDTMHGAQVTGLLYYGLEDLFYAVADSHARGLERRKSGYSFDIDAAPIDFVSWMVNPHLGPREASRYYGLNWASLTKYGTLEFRHLPLTLDRQVVINWIDALARLKSFAYNNLRMDLDTPGTDVLDNPSIITRAVPYVFERFGNVIPQFNESRMIVRMERMAAMIDAAQSEPASVRRFQQTQRQQPQQNTQRLTPRPIVQVQESWAMPSSDEVVRVTLGNTSERDQRDSDALLREMEALRGSLRSRPTFNPLNRS